MYAVRRLAATLGAAAVLVSACSLHVDVLDVTADTRDSTVIDVLLNICGAKGLTLEFVETDTAIEVTATAEGSSNDACAQALPIELGSPIGDRVVIDTTSGRRIQVTFRGGHN